METLKSYGEAIREVDSGKRSLLILITGNPGEQFIISSEMVGTGLLKIQRKNKGRLLELCTKNISEIL